MFYHLWDLRQVLGLRGATITSEDRTCCSKQFDLKNRYILHTTEKVSNL